MSEFHVWDLIRHGMSLATLESLDLDQIDKLAALRQMEQDHQDAFSEYLKSKN